MMYDYLLQPDFETGDLLGRGRDPALDHRGDHNRLLQLHREQVARLAATGQPLEAIGPLLMRRIADARTMRAAVDALLRGGPKAPGPDGLCLEDLEDAERWSLCRALALAVREGRYRPGPVRRHAIAKGPGRGTRQLAIQNAADRIVGKAAALILEPVADKVFFWFSLGFRPGRGPWEALAVALALAQRERRTAWITADVAGAFDAMPQGRLRHACAALFPPEVVAFIALLTSTGQARGIPQGSPFSPLAWNLFAHHHLDRVFVAQAVPGRLLRYADDLVVLCASLQEAEGSYRRLAKIARSAGTPLKGDAAASIVALADGAPATYLGYQVVRQGSSLALTIAPRAWDRLAERLAEAHTRPAAPLRAVAILQGWLAYVGPCFVHEQRREVLGRVRAAALAQGFDEIPTRRALDGYWQRAYARWQRVYAREVQVLPQRLAPLGGGQVHGPEASVLPAVPLCPSINPLPAGSPPASAPATAAIPPEPDP